MRRFLILLIFVLSCCFTAGAEARNFALLVGVNDYRDYTHFRKLHSCVKDMQDLKKALIRIGFEEDDIIVFTDNERSAWNTPYKKLIEDKIKEILEKTQEGDLVFFAFSGHGVRKDNTDYFCPQDAYVENIERTCVSITQVMADLKNSKATFKWMVIDACRYDPRMFKRYVIQPSKDSWHFSSQSLKAFRGISVSDLKEGIVLFQSCKKDEISYEEKCEDGNGYFMKNFVAALSGLDADANQDGEIILGEVLTWTAKQTKEDVMKFLREVQTPYVQGDYDPNLILFKDLKFQRAKELASEAYEAMKAKNFKLARDKFKEALELHPQSDSWQRDLELLDQILDSKPESNVTVPNK